MTVADRALARALQGEGPGLRVLVEGEGALSAVPGAVALPVSDRATLGVASGLMMAGHRVVVAIAAARRLPALAEALAEAAASGGAGAIVVWTRWADAVDGDGFALLSGLPGVTLHAPADDDGAVAAVRIGLSGGVHVVAVADGASAGAAAGLVGSAALVTPPLDPGSWGGAGVTVLALGAALPVARAAALDDARIEVLALARAWPPDAEGLREVGASVQRTGRLVVVVPEGGGALADRLRQVGADGGFWFLEAPAAMASAADAEAVRAAVDAVWTA